MFYIHSLFSMVCYTIFIMIFTGIFFRERKAKRFHKVALIAGMMVVVSIIISLLYNHFILKEIGVILGFSFFLWRLYDAKYLKALILTFFFIGGCIVADYAILLLIMNVMPEGSMLLLESAMGSSLVEVFSECVHLLIIIILVRCLRKKDSELLTTKEWLRFAIVPIITLSIIAAFLLEFDLAQKEHQEWAFLMSAIGLVVMNIIIYFLLNDILKREAALREERVFKERMEQEVKMYHSLSENYEKQRRFQHEYKNQMECISALVQKENYEELQKYLESLHLEFTELVNVIDVNHIMINSILNAKYQEMRKKGIALIPRITDCSQIPISDEDIVVILANLLNNAIEACADSEEKLIKLKLTHDDTGVIISVINTYAKAPVMNGDKFQSTKVVDKEMHGIGISNVKDVVKKYGGATSIHVTDKEFQFVIMIDSAYA